MLKPEILFFMLLTTTSLATCAFALLFWKLNRVTRELVTFRDQTKKQDGHEEKKPASLFDRDLVLAEMKTILKQPKEQGNLPNRYRYINSLVSHGLDSVQIAQILEIGRGEAEQLVKLASLRSASTTYRECAA